jgi:hypothetical protein
MSKIITDSIKKNLPHFKKYKKYIQENDWENLKAKDLEEGSKGKQKTTVDLRLEEFKVQDDLVKAIVERLKTFVKRAEGDHHLKVFKDFVKETTSIIEYHTNRADKYTTDSNISSIKDIDLRASEVAFHNILFKAVSSIEDAVSALNIKDDQVAEGIQFLSSQKSTIPMYKDLATLYPEVEQKIKDMGIDLISPPPKTIHILNPNPPIWNKDKNIWEQEKATLQYYFDEQKKIDYGVDIDGYYIDGWLYFHFNYFVTNIPTTVIKGGIDENEDIIKVPDLRDNEILITSYFRKSKKDGLMSLIAATRRAAKTTMNASRLVRAQILAKKQILCAGGASEDLGHIANNIETCNDNINPAFKMYYLSTTEDGRGKSYGIKTKDNKSKVIANIFIINLEGGTNKKKKETLAGFTPDEFILDEAMKFPFKSQLEALEPALWGSGVLRCNVIITGTGGNEDLAVDAIKMLSNPKDNKVTLMDWKELDKHVPKDLITWNERPFGLFLPTQMSVKHKKIKSNLADYLGIESETLKKVSIYITDWEKAKIDEDKERESKIGDKVSYVRLLAYHPYDPSEIFLSGRISPFPLAETKAHRQYLIDTGKWDRRREIFRDSDGKVQTSLSVKDLIQYPHNGGNADAPCLIFEDLPKEKPKYGTYVGSFDDYNSEDSDTESVSTFYVMKNKILGDPFSEKIVASLSFKPKKHIEVWEKWLMLMEAYNLEGTVFGENFNYEIKTYLDKYHLADKYLAPSLDFTQSFNLPNNLKRKTGWSPMLKKTLFNMFVDYCNEEFEVEGENGESILLKGVQRIDDIILLDEILKYSVNGNFDRITSAQANISFIYFLNASHRWKPGIYKQQEDEIKKPKVRQDRGISPYGSGRNRGFYSNGRR